MSESERPPEGEDIPPMTAGCSTEPLTYEQEIHSLLYKARTWGRDLRQIFERERRTSGALSPEERRINGICIENFAADLARIDAAIPLAAARRSSSSPSADGRRQCRCGEWVRDERTPPREEAWSVGASFVVDDATGKLHSCKALLAAPSVPTAAAPKLDPITDYWFAHYVNENMCSLCAQSGIIDTTAKRTPAGLEVGRRNFCICPNGQSLRARVQGENSQ